MELLGFDVAGWLVCLVVLLATILILSSRNFGMFKEQGIPGPTPWPLIGTSLSYFTKGIFESDTYNAKKYGKIVGMFEGTTPVLLVSDLDMMKQIMVKDFNNFRNRRPFQGQGYPLRSALTSLNDDHWKYVRNRVSPAFSGGKLKAMIAHLNKSARDFVYHLEQKTQKDETFDLKNHANSYTLDVIAGTAFGLQIDSQKDDSNPFVQNSKKIFQFSLFNITILVAFFLPFLGDYLDKFNVSSFDKEALNFFVDIVDRTMKQRKESDSKQSDFLQLMMQAQNEEVETTDESIKLNEDSKFAQRKGLTKEEILAQSVLFFLAGYDTTATTIAFTGYNLATNQDAQDKLCRDIDELLGDEDRDVTIEDLNQLPYLDMVMNETLRMYPPAARLERYTSNSTEINGIKIPKGSIVAFPMWAIHLDPEIWEEPQKFKPERFSAEEKAKRNMFTWLPFGAGPRNCVGMRLAQVEVKMAILQALRKHRFVTTEQTQIPPVVDSIRMAPKDGILLKLESRK